MALLWSQDLRPAALHNPVSDEGLFDVYDTIAVLGKLDHNVGD